MRAFAKAALRLLRDAADAAAEPAAEPAAELARQCDWCVGALKLLGRKSDVARLVGDTIGAKSTRSRTASSAMAPGCPRVAGLVRTIRTCR